MGDYDFKHHDRQGIDRSVALVIPTSDVLVCDLTAGDYSVDTTSVDADRWDNCRYIWADGAGIVKIDRRDAVDNSTTITEVLYVNRGEMIPIRNITKVYQNYAAQTASTSQVYTAAGSLVYGLKLRR